MTTTASFSAEPSEGRTRPIAEPQPAPVSQQTHEERRADGMLLAAMQRGEAGAIDRFYASYYQMFLGLMVRQVGDFHTAQDLAHDAILKVIRHVSSYTPGAGTPRAWLRSVLNHAFVDWTRRQKHRRTTEFDARNDDDNTFAGTNEPAESEPGPADQAEAAEKIAAVQSALMMLDDGSRQLVTLRLYEGLSAQEVAAVLNTTAERVGGRLFRAKQRLRAILEANWPDLFPG